MSPLDPTRSSPPASNRDEVTFVPVDSSAKMTGTHGSPESRLASTVEAPPGYVIEGELGRGGMGVVYLACQQGLNRPVALKMVLGSGLIDEKALIRFLAEAEAVASIKHPNVVEVYQFGEHGGRPFMALEFCSGGSLDGKVKAGRIEPRPAVELMAQIAAGVEAAHAQGMVHRDLKPQNVLLAEDGQPKVTDFGLAKKAASKSDLTNTNAIMGTPAYMSPEQAQGGTKFVGPSADVWSLGVIFYEMLTGEKPFQGDDAWSILGQVVKGEVVPVARRAPEVPRDLALVVEKCLRKEPAERYADAGGLAADLKAWLEGRAISVRPAGRVELLTKWIRRNKAVAASLLSAMLAMLVGTGMSLWQAERAMRAAKNEEERSNQLASAMEDLSKEQGKTKEAFNDLQAEQKKTKEALDESKRQERKALESLAYNNLLLAESTFNGLGTAAQAIEFLESTPERFRDWEHGYLRRKYEGSFATLNAHTDTVRAVAFSPDGSQLATASDDKSVRLWDAKSGYPLRELKGHQGHVRAVCFSPDGNRLVSGGTDNTLRLWDAQSGMGLLELRGHTGSVNGVAFSPDGARVASASNDRTVRVWDVQRGQVLRELRGHEAFVYAVSFSPDGSRLASASFDKTVRLWDAKTGVELGKFSGHDTTVLAVAFSPDGSRLASASDHTALLWDARNGHVLMRLTGHTDAIWGIAFSPDGSRLASASSDRTVRVWDTRSGFALLELRGHTDILWGVAFSPDGTRLATTSSDRTVRIWDAQRGRHLLELDKHASFAWGVSYSSDGSKLAWASDDQTVRIRDPRSGHALSELKGQTGIYSRLAFSPDGERLASETSMNTVGVWDTRSGQLLMKLKGHTSQVKGVSFSSNGELLASGASDGTARLWDARTGQFLSELKGRFGSVNSVAFSPDGNQLATASDDKMVRLWDPKTGQRLFELRGHSQEVHDVSFSQDGLRLASASNDKTVRVWEVGSGQQLLELKGHTAPVTSVTFSPNGTRLASASFDKTVRLWDTQYGRQLLELKGYSMGSLSFSPDGLQLATATPDATVWVLESRIGSPRYVEKEWPEWAKASLRNSVLSPDGKFIWTKENENRFLRSPLEPTAEEVEFRRAMCRPATSWHLEQLSKAKQAKDGFAMAMHVYLWHKATAEDHFEYNRWDQAFYWQVAAEILKPKPPVIDWPELLAKPMELR